MTWNRNQNPCTRRAFLGVAGASAAAGMAAAQMPAPPYPRPSVAAPTLRPNVLLLVLDSLRSDHVGVYGYTRNTSPHLDRLANQGVRFTQAISQSSYTRESVTAIFTGMLPSESGGMGWMAQPRRGTTLAERFHAAGYRTGLFTDTPMLGFGGFKRGFDLDHLEGDEPVPSGLAPALARRTAAFAAADRESPFFAYVHFIDPHAPYRPPTDFYHRMTDNPQAQALKLYTFVRPELEALKRSGFGPGDIRFDDLVARYDAEIAHVDSAVGALLDALQESGQLENTVVVVSADHGEEFLDHGFVEHAWRLYRESTQVPLIVWSPARLAPAVCDIPVALIDVYPTLLALAGLEVPEGLSGHPLLERTSSGFTLAAKPRPIMSELLVQSRNMLRTLRDGDWKYTAAVQWHPTETLAEVSRNAARHDALPTGGKAVATDPFGPTVYEELFCVREDPNEQVNRIAQEPERREQFRTTLAAYTARCKTMHAESADPIEAAPSLSNADREAMEALGYI